MNKHIKGALIYSSGVVCGLVVERVYTAYKIAKSLEKRDRNDNFRYEEIIFDSYKSAEAVLEEMKQLVKNYAVVTVADMQELSSIESDCYDSKYGWTNLRDAKVIRCRYGYRLNLPKPKALNRH